MTKWILAFTLLVVGFFSNAATLSGTVFGDGEIVADVTVVLLDANQNELDSQVTQTDGRYRFDAVVVGGNYYLTLTATQESEYKPVAATPVVMSTAVQVEDFLLVKPVPVPVPVPVYSISGNMSTESGYAIEGQRLSRGVYTDVSGDYELTGIRATDAVVIATYSSRGASVVHVTDPDFTVSAGEFIGARTPSFSLHSDKVLNLKMPLVIFNGRVTDSNGSGIAGVRVVAETINDIDTEVYDESIYGFYVILRQKKARAISDSNGDFTLALLENRDFKFEFYPPAGRPDFDTETALFSTGEIDLSHSFSLTTITRHSITGQVQTESGYPIEG